MTMDIPYEKMSEHETPSSSMIMIDGPTHVQPAPVRIRHYFVFSLFSAICLCPATGLIALAYSLKSSAKADVKFHDKARLYARRALLWNIISVIFVILSFILVLVFFYYLSEMTKSVSFTTDDMLSRRPSTALAAEVNGVIQSLTDAK